MLGNAVKNIKFIQATLAREFRTVSMIKALCLVLLPGIFAFSAKFFGWDPMPSWAWLIVTIVLGLGVIIFIVANRARQIEEPKLAVVCGNSRIFRQIIYPYKVERSSTEIRIGVTNISALKVDNVELILANAISLDGKEAHDINMNIREDNSLGASKVSINGYVTKYYHIATFIHPATLEELKTEELMAVVLDNEPFPDTHISIGGRAPKLERGKEYRLKINVSGDTSPNCRVYFRIGVTEKGELIFKPEEELCQK